MNERLNEEKESLGVGQNREYQNSANQSHTSLITNIFHPTGAIYLFRKKTLYEMSP